METSQNITADGDYILRCSTGTDTLTLKGAFGGATVTLYVSDDGTTTDILPLSDGVDMPATITEEQARNIALWSGAPLVLKVTGASGSTNIDARTRG